MTWRSSPRSFHTYSWKTFGPRGHACAASEIDVVARLDSPYAIPFSIATFATHASPLGCHIRWPAVGEGKKGSRTLFPKIFVDKLSGGFSPRRTLKCCNKRLAEDHNNTASSLLRSTRARAYTSRHSLAPDPHAWPLIPDHPRPKESVCPKATLASTEMRRKAH